MSNIRAPDENLKLLAKKDYMDGMKYKDIADKYNVSLNTIKSWKQRYNWNRKSVHTNKKVCTQNNRKDLKKKDIEEPIADEVKEVLENTELTDKQRLFCIYYIERFNATWAYQKAYECEYDTARVNASRMLTNANIREEIKRLTDESLDEQELNAKLIFKRIFQKYMDIAFSDIGDYLSFKKVRKNKWTTNKDGEDIPVINPDTGQQDFFEYNTVELKDSSNVDTSLLQEVSEGKDGVKIKLYDKLRAFQWLTTHIGYATEEERLKIEKLKAEINKLTGDNQELEDTREIDGEIYGD